MDQKFDSFFSKLLEGFKELLKPPNNNCGCYPKITLEDYFITFLVSLFIICLGFLIHLMTM